MNITQIIVLVLACVEIGFGIFWLVRVAARNSQPRNTHLEHQRMVSEGGLIQRKRLTDSLMMIDPNSTEYEEPRKIINPQALVGLCLIFGGILVAFVGVAFLGDV